MAKSKKTKKKTLNKEILKEIEYLRKLIRISLSAVEHKSVPLDELFVEQANKLMDQVKKLEKTQ